MMSESGTYHTMKQSNKENSKRIAKNTLLLYIRLIFTMAVGLFTSRVIYDHSQAVGKVCMEYLSSFFVKIVEGCRDFANLSSKNIWLQLSNR